MRQKKVFKLALAALAIMLMVLPFMVSFNDLLTRIVEGAGWYRWIQEKVVPFEVRLIGVMVRPFNLDFVAYQEGFRVRGTYARLSWNCLGWQSLLLFLLSLPIGFRGGSYTFFSKCETFLIGLLGTFLANLFRITFTVLLLAYSRPLYAIVFHDYLAAIVTICWLVLFWWFAYSFVLEEKLVKGKKDDLSKLKRLQEKFKGKKPS